MSQTRQPDDPRPPLTLARLEQLLDAYGGAPERWPEAEREAVLQLMLESAAARARWDEATELDALLDTVEVEPPSPALAARTLGAAPRRRPARAWQRIVATAIPVAAAAAVVLWFVTDRPAPVADLTLVSVGEYSSPTDVLLGEYGVDVYGSVPSIGCADSTLGCPDVKATGGPVSRRRVSGRIRV